MLQYHDIHSDDDLQDAREDCAAGDQADELCIGAQTWGIIYQGGQRGQMTRLPNGRGAISLGSDSEWGDWEGGRLYLDDNAGEYDDSGKRV